MIRSILLILFISFSASAMAQVTIPFEFTSEDENRLIKENDSLKFYVANGDTTNTVVINEENTWYKLLNKNRKVVAEGAYLVEADRFIQDGKWVSYFENGKVKLSGYFKKSLPIGTWQEYFSSGKLKKVSNYGLFVYKGEPVTGLSGTYQEFFASGNLKVNGFYGSVVFSYKDTVYIEDPVSGNKILKPMVHNDIRAEKMGHWEYFTDEGELERKDDF